MYYLPLVTSKAMNEQTLQPSTLIGYIKWMANIGGRNLNIQRGDMTKGDKEVDRKHTVLDILSLLSLLSLVSYSLLSSFNHHYCLFNIYSRHPVFVADSKLLVYYSKLLTSIIQIYRLLVL